MFRKPIFTISLWLSFRHNIPFWSKIDFQGFISLSRSFLEMLNDFILIWLFFILLVLLIRSQFILIPKIYRVLKPELEALEVFWTTFPIFILLRIAFPRFFLLNSQDSIFPKRMFKLIRRQWNWQRELLLEEFDHLLDYQGIFFKSNLESPAYLFSQNLQMVTRSTDVLHSVGVPNLGVKIDSSPGRLNSTVIELLKPGLYWGSCYELCGRGHRAIPFSFLIF